MSAADATKRLRAYAGRASKAARRGLFEGANAILTDAKKRCPVDLGNLKGSGYATQPEATADGVRVQVGFGGPATPYALRQHEELGWHHDVGEAKYLENAVDAKGSEVPRLVAQRVAEAM